MNVRRRNLMAFLKNRQRKNDQILKRREQRAKLTLELHKKGPLARKRLFKKSHKGAWKQLLLLCHKTKKEDAAHWLALAEQVIRLKHRQAPLPMPPLVHKGPLYKAKYMDQLLTSVAFGHNPLSLLAIAVGVLKEDKRRDRKSLRLKISLK